MLFNQLSGIKMSLWYENFKFYRESTYHLYKRWNLDEYPSEFRYIKCRKWSRYQQMRDSSYDNYMIDGLCSDNYRGLEKIKHFRLKYIRKIKSI